MDQMPLSLNVRDAYQLEQLISQADGMILKQILVLLKLRLAGKDTTTAENEMAELRQDVARLRAQRSNVEIDLGLHFRAAE